MDVLSIQTALKKLGYYTGMLDGIAGKLTDKAIREFQKAQGLKVDGIVGPNTIKALAPSSKAPVIPAVEGTLLTAASLKRLWPNARPEIIAGVAASAGTALPMHKITTKKRLSDLMTTVSHESGGGRIYEENLNYTKASRIAQVWPSRFTVASAAPYVLNARALANKVYNGRMGNRVGTDDGWNYRGRGLIQLTGRDAYIAVGKLAKLDLVNNPSLATEPQNLLPIACAFWTWKGLNDVSDGIRAVKTYPRGSLEAVTQIVNGGQIGLADRRSWQAKWKRELGL